MIKNGIKIIFYFTKTYTKMKESKFNNQQNLINFNYSGNVGEGNKDASFWNLSTI